MTPAALEQELESRGPKDLPAASDPLLVRRSTIFWLVLAAFAVRLAFLLVLQTYRPGQMDDYSIPSETTNVATSIAWGHGFSSPLNGDPTGPTAWIPPGYPYFVALVFRIFGVMTQSSFIFIFVVQSLFSALTVLPIMGIARHSVGMRAGLWSAWVWALFPWFIKWSVTWLWDTSLSALLLSLLIWYALKLPEATSRRSWTGFGALWGLTLLVNPTLATFFPVSLAWSGYELHRHKKEWLKPILSSVLVCVVVISPWLLRNRVVFGQWVFIRSDFGYGFALGNYHSSLGRGWGGSDPAGNQKEFQKYWQMGEIAYVRSRKEQALQFVRQYPKEFIVLTAKRVSYFWDGSSIYYRTPIPWYWMPSSFGVVSFLLLPALLVARRRRLHGWSMFFGGLLLYPLPYYLTFSVSRYRHAIEPLMVLLICYAGVEATGKFASFVAASRERAGRA
jgi:4-amino-4-deoxy-L-arabinose transferase-like glycosyltransferase